MNITSSEKHTLLTAKTSFDAFKQELSNVFGDFKDQNIVLDFSNIKVTEEDIQSLEKYAETQAENNLSFAIIAVNFDADAFEEELNVVPTLTEAEDIIDMDEMTRDLGF
ncbi:hypothetical protein FHR24_000982 [Wenyingzhuangia heitensis]|uniref:Uncharacterized protein n=1 Tax=Wenyingzhuangia heitensis TaxID=1487859 RepID=A0ABX0U715_9FLAO|nr:hypothetical protein [Wenyingzhuangia heitensis]NIJ44543.1 hypothetical protein [Wenyingzhuangia heitensis]